MFDIGKDLRARSRAWIRHRPPEPSISLNWPETRADFLEYLKMRHYDPETARDLVSYLDRFVTSPITGPHEVVKLFAPLSVGQQHHLNRALRAWLKFLEVSGQAETEKLTLLRRAIPRDQLGNDIWIPEEGRIISDLQRLPEAPRRYRVAYLTLLYSGLRLVEATEILNRGGEGAEKVNGIIRIPIGMFRGQKQCYYAYLIEEVLQEIRNIEEKTNYRAISGYLKKKGYIAPKYLRKFAFDKMLSLGIPESIADFIQGRAPQKTGIKHYTQLMRQADQHYPKYAEYLKQLRERANLTSQGESSPSPSSSTPGGGAASAQGEDRSLKEIDPCEVRSDGGSG